MRVDPDEGQGDALWDGCRRIDDHGVAEDAGLGRFNINAALRDRNTWNQLRTSAKSMVSCVEAVRVTP
jgi:hypothetical protein